MLADFINPFLSSINNVLTEVVPNIQIQRGQLSKQKNPVKTKGCSSLISITGEIEGRVVLDMNKDTAIKISNAFIDEELDDFEVVSSTINELANMICGGAITILGNSGKKVDISAPTMFLGENMEIYDSSAVGDAIVVPVETNYGNLYVNVAMTETT